MQEKSMYVRLKEIELANDELRQAAIRYTKTGDQAAVLRAAEAFAALAVEGEAEEVAS